MQTKDACLVFDVILNKEWVGEIQYDYVDGIYFANMEVRVKISDLLNFS